MEKTSRHIMIGECTKEQLLPQIIKSICIELDIQYLSLSDNWLLHMKRSGESHWIVGCNFDLNNASSARIAADKVATYLILNSEQIPAIEHVLAKSIIDNSLLFAPLQHLDPYRPYVVKPLKGNGGRDVTLHRSLQAAIEHMSQSTLQEIAVSPWHNIISEKRIILLDNQPLLAFEKEAAKTIDGLKFYNLGQGAAPLEYQPSKEELNIAKRAMTACSLRLAAVDIVTLATGQQLVLEINSGITLENYARHSEANAATARAVYKKIILAVFS